MVLKFGHLTSRSKYLGSFEMWCWSGTVKISWTDRVRNGEVLHRVKDEMNTRKVKWIGNILRENCCRSILEVKSLHFTGETEKIHENTHSA